ncbi:hypothetical protein Tco_1491158, partial [Tanacetum coccineum]
MMDDEEDDEVTNKLYKDVNVNLGQQNVSQESRFEKVKEDDHVTLTLNPSLADNKIASLMGTSSRHTTEVPEITSSFTTTIPPPPPFFNPLPQQATPTPTPTTSEATTSFPSLLDFSYVFKFNNKVTNLKKDLSEIKQVDQYTQSLSSIPAIVAAALSEFERTKILIDKMEKNKSYDKAGNKRELYDALVKSYQTDKD